ncbi:MAG: GNAT family N-acetyltransferase [Candidatus Eremiobacteraeota bacterium]|nr:GNAT family N-acetyltransferase [Candidatus Eremiobacteraeota bacterium]
MPTDDKEPTLIRGTRPGDAEQIATLLNLPGFRRNTLRVPFQTPEQVRGWLERSVPDTTAVVACRGDTVVGAADLRRFRGRRAHAGEIGLGVHDDYVRTGIGSALLSALIDTSERWLALTRLELAAYTDNDPALALYRKFGFVVEGTYRAYAFRDGTFTDAHCMARLTRRDD